MAVREERRWKHFPGKKSCNLLVEENNCHCYLITNMKAFSISYQCVACKKFFTWEAVLEKHKLACRQREVDGVTRHMYPGSYVLAPEEYLRRPRSFWCCHPPTPQAKPGLGVFNLETYETFMENNSKSTVGTHTLLAYTVMSNQPRFTHTCHSSDTSMKRGQMLCREMLGYLEDIMQCSAAWCHS